VRRSACRTNAVLYSRDPSKLEGATVVLTVEPCASCTSLFIGQARRVNRIIAMEPHKPISYPDQSRRDETDQVQEALDRAGVSFKWYKPSSPNAAESVALHQKHLRQALVDFQSAEP